MNTCPTPTTSLQPLLTQWPFSQEKTPQGACAVTVMPSYDLRLRDTPVALHSYSTLGAIKNCPCGFQQGMAACVLCLLHQNN